MLFYRRIFSAFEFHVSSLTKILEYVCGIVWGKIVLNSHKHAHTHTCVI